MRGRGKVATTQSCKLVKLLCTCKRSVCIVCFIETHNSYVPQQGVSEREKVPCCERDCWEPEGDEGEGKGRLCVSCLN